MTKSLNTNGAKIVSIATDHIELTREFLEDNEYIINEYKGRDFYGEAWFDRLADCDCLFFYDKDVQDSVINFDINRVEYNLDYRHVSWKKAISECELINWVDLELEKLKNGDNNSLINAMRERLDNSDWIKSCYLNIDDEIILAFSDLYEKEDDLIADNQAAINDLFDKIYAKFNNMIKENNRIIFDEYEEVFYKNDMAIEEILCNYTHYSIDNSSLVYID